MEALAAIVPEAGADFELQTVEVEAPHPGEILVDVKACGICHTDLVLKSGVMGNPFPAVFGHEGAGIVHAVGEGVTSVKPGDKVLLTFDSCGECRFCEADQPAYCVDFNQKNMACRRPDGSTRLSKDGEAVHDNCFTQSAFASIATARERNTLKLPDDADLAALAPLGCGIQTGSGATLNALKAQPGESLIVIGGGAVGLSAMLGGVIAGCETIIMVEPQEGRRKLALELGATHVIDPMAVDKLSRAIRDILPNGAHMLVDTSGHVPTLAQTPTMVDKLGRIGLVGLTAPDATLPVPIMRWIGQGGTVRGVCEGDSDPKEFIPKLIGWHQEGKLPLERFCTQYSVRDINKAIEDAHSGKCIKPVLIFD